MTAPVPPPPEARRAHASPLKVDDVWRPDFWRDPLFADAAPFLAPWAGLGDWPSLDAYNALLDRQGAWPADAPRFRAVWQVPPPPRRGARREKTEAAADASEAFLAGRYETAVIGRGEVPTRPRNWHDVFNVLSYAMFPRSKHALMARFWTAWQQRPAGTSPGRRTREQDALTILDEASVVLAAEEDALAAALGGQAPRSDLRHAGPHLAALAADSRCRPLVLGHALHESALFHRPSVHAAVCVVALPRLPEDPVALVDAADRALAQALTQGQGSWPSSPTAFGGLPFTSLIARMVPSGV